MKIIIAPQALKGSLEATQAAAAIARGARRVWHDVQYTLLPVADGGEGTTRALVEANSGQMIIANVTGPLGEPVEGFFGILPATDGPATAVIEMAAAAGLPLVPEKQRNPRITTTRGVGELFRLALDRGCRRFIIGIGGSATNDGGAGMAQALGASLLDDGGAELPAGGAALARLSRIDASRLDARLQECTVLVACDVTNPLCGPEGASAIYGPQKGATPAMVAELDAALAHYAEIIKRDLGKDVRDVPGAGAAGGLGAGVLAFFNATLTPGAALILDTLRLDEHLRGAALLFTAEGRLDGQTVYGKSVGAVAARAQAQGVPVVALAGSLGDGYEALYQIGVSAVVPLPDAPMPLDTAMQRADDLLAAAAERAARLIRMGWQMPPKE
ncbi:MAG TPA: glycerate kinase [Ktedonobacterales bacterium]|nr:glycerate kinase [Ktedonobacterales bacterium]